MFFNAIPIPKGLKIPKGALMAHNANPVPIKATPFGA
jgi:hypothetical protein